MKAKVNVNATEIPLREGQFYRVTPDKIVDAPYDVIRAHVETGAAFFTETIPYNPKSKDKLLFEGKNASGNGFGYALQETLLALNEITDVYSTQPSGGEDIHPEVLDIGNKYLETPDCVGIIFDSPIISRDTLPTEIAGIYTTFETTRLNPLSVANINKFNFCIVTSEFAKKCFLDSGVTIPLYVAPHGVRSDIFTFYDRPTPSIFTFGHYGSLTPRKGTHIAVQAFERAFPKGKYGDKVRLEIRTVMRRGDKPPFWDLFPFDERITTTYGFIPKSTLVNKLHSWNALVCPTKGEGFSMCAAEGMATGLPVIVTGWSGHTDFIKDMQTGIYTKYNLVEADWYGIDMEGRDQKGLLGMGAEPDIDDVAGKMLWVYENYEEAKRIGRNAAREMAKNWTWHNSAKAIVKAKNDYLKNYYHETSKTNNKRERFQ